MTSRFAPRELDGRLSYLEACPEKLLPRLLGLALGTIEQRVRGLAQVREALLEGNDPDFLAWPGGPVGRSLRHSIEALGIARFCKDQPELVDELLEDLLAAAEAKAEILAEAVETRYKDMVRLCLVELGKADPAKCKDRSGPAVLGQRELASLKSQATQLSLHEDLGDDVLLLETWGGRVDAWTQVFEVFGDLGLMLERGWDLARGILKHQGWTKANTLAAILGKLPELRQIVQTLGRLQTSSDGPSVAEELWLPVRRLEEELREVLSPLVPGETRGVDRSGEVGRMLASEAALLGHPKLRLLWHARRAERALLTYRLEGLEVERQLVETFSQERVEKQTPRPERGPILVVLDTSGSMIGLPELVAKALTLEAMRTAHQERRRCYLYLYSGAGDIVEQELDLSEKGIGGLLDFLGYTFGGGNDETGVLKRVLGRLKEEAWRRADVMFVSDGIWPVPRDMLDAVSEAKKTGTRFHGVQIGTYGQSGLHSVCDPVHNFRDWANLTERV